MYSRLNPMNNTAAYIIVGINRKMFYNTNEIQWSMAVPQLRSYVLRTGIVDGNVLPLRQRTPTRLHRVCIICIQVIEPGEPVEQCIMHIIGLPPGVVSQIVQIMSQSALKYVDHARRIGALSEVCNVLPCKGARASFAENELCYGRRYKKRPFNIIQIACRPFLQWVFLRAWLYVYTNSLRICCDFECLRYKLITPFQDCAIKTHFQTAKR